MHKYAELKEKILRPIQNGKIRAGEKLPGVRELMARHGVSLATLQNALGQLVREGVLDLRHGSGIYVRELKRPTALPIGLILPSAENPFLNRFVQLLLQDKRSSEVNVVTKISSYDPLQERRAANELLEVGARGIFILPEPTSANRRFFEKISVNTAPVVSVIRRFVDSEITHVVPDNRSAGRLAARHLLSRGARNLLYIGNKILRPVDERVEGFLEAAEAGGAPMSRRRIVFHSSDNSLEGGMKSFEYAFTRIKSIDGVMAYHDLYAAGVYRYCAAHGIRVPEDLRLIGCDNLDFSAYLTPALTTVDSNLPELASLSLALLLEKISDPKKAVESRVLRPELVVRATS